MTLHQRPARLKRVVIPVPAGLTVRQVLEAQIEAMIDRLDAMDPDPDLEETGDLEPSIGERLGCAVDAELDDSDLEPDLGAAEGGLHGGASNQEHWARGIDAEQQCEDEGADFDNGDPWTGEPSLGSLDASLDQRRWAGGYDNDRELDDADNEDGGDAEPSLGWSNPLGARVDGACRLIVERVPDRQVRRTRPPTRHVTRDVTRDAAVRL